MIDVLRILFARELAGVRDQIAAYPDDDAPWQLLPGWRNSAGTLALHLAGNLQHFIGAVHGGTGYLRDREAEFTRRGLSREEILREVAAAELAVEAGLDAVAGDGVPGGEVERLAAPFPEEVGGRRVSTGTHLLHLLSHTAYHLGQIDYHRRAVTGDPGELSLVSREPLPSLE
jgi:hypothetical protein